MWSQYAEDHRGACLIFDQWALVEGVSQAQSGTRHLLATGSVEYTDAPLSDHLPHPDNLSIEAEGFGEAVERHQSSHMRELYFQKNSDWASEREYRVIVFPEATADDPLLWPFGNSLVAVALGERCAITIGAVEDALAAHGLAAVTVVRLAWEAGVPRLDRSH
jgi:hypothetical protein